MILRELVSACGSAILHSESHIKRYFGEFFVALRTIAFASGYLRLVLTKPDRKPIHFVYHNAAADRCTPGGRPDAGDAMPVKHFHPPAWLTTSSKVSSL